MKRKKKLEFTIADIIIINHPIWETSSINPKIQKDLIQCKCLATLPFKKVEVKLVSFLKIYQISPNFILKVKGDIRIK